jgi:hypothetical protein
MLIENFLLFFDRFRKPRDSLDPGFWINLINQEMVVRALRHS